MEYIDYNLAMEYLGGNVKLFHMIKNSFLDSYKNYEALLLKLNKEQNYSELYHEIHNLKGITLNFGARRLYEIALVVLESMKNKIYDEKKLNDYLIAFKETYKELKNM